MSSDYINETMNGSMDSSDWEESRKLEAGTMFGGKYRLEKRAGRGGMGEVWKAFDTIGERFVALKFVPRDVQRFEAEMTRVKETFKVIQGLIHQNICPVYSLENDPVYGYYLVMQWLEGETLDKIQYEKKWEHKKIISVLKKVADALDYAHSQKVVHRDIKPVEYFCKKGGEGRQRGQTDRFRFGDGNPGKSYSCFTGKNQYRRNSSLYGPGTMAGT